MQLKLKKGPGDLEARVLKQDMCCACGACIGLCPYFLVMHEHVVLSEPCGLTEGRCYDVCPRTVVDVDELNAGVFGEARSDFALGTNRGVFMSQAAGTAVREKGQYGGSVTALLAHGLETGTIDGAILAGKSERYGLLPEPVLARTVEEVVGCAGSKYSGCPTLKILDLSLRECKKLAVVGRPCQVIALRKRIAVEPEIKEKISLVIGLFCMWSLEYKRLAVHLRGKVELSKAKKIDIPYNRFVVFTEQGREELDFEPIKGLRRKSCDICFDFTSELADVSVGSTEWKEDWNTLIPRTEAGAKAVEEAKKAGALAVQPLPEERIKLLRQASLGKKKRVLEALKNGAPLADYLKIGEEERKAVLGG